MRFFVENERDVSELGNHEIHEIHETDVEEHPDSFGVPPSGGPGTA
jgi:hypothetical protein